MRTGTRWAVALVAAAAVAGLVAVPAPPAHAGLPGSDGLIVFVEQASGGGDIYVMNPDGTNVQQVTSGIADDEFPVVSPNGQEIAYSSNSDGSSGTTSAYNIWIVDLATGDKTKVTKSGGTTFNTYPSWKGDGTELAYQKGHSPADVWIVNADGTGNTQLTHKSGFDGLPAWSASGSRIAFSSDRTGNFELFTIAPSGKDLKRLTHKSASDLYPKWGPKGKRIAFMSDRSGNFDVWTITPAGTDVNQVTHKSALDGYPEYSPDGHLLTFVSDRSGSNQIWSMPSSGHGLVNQITTSQPLAAFPAPDWQPLQPSVTATVGSSGFSPDPLALQLDNGNFIPSWQFLDSNTSDHTVSDNSGMDLFGSGPMPAGSQYAFPFFAAGSYPVVDDLGTGTQTVNVAPFAVPESGDESATFTITWAVVPAPAGFAYDVLVTDPCDGDPVIDWQPNVSNPSDTFIPTTGPGTYTFQARLVNTGNGHTTGYTAVHIDVTGGPPGSGCPTTGPTPTGSPS